MTFKPQINQTSRTLKSRSFRVRARLPPSRAQLSGSHFLRHTLSHTLT